MIKSNIFLETLSCLTPIISALLWAAIMALAIKDSMTQKEENIKHNIFWFFIGEAFGWIAIVVYTYWPVGFVYINAVAYLSFLMRHVLFFRFIFLMTQKPRERFPVVHYIIPLIISGLLFVWSFFIPFDVQLKLVEGRGAIVSKYLLYSRMFLFKPLMHFIYSAVYLLLITVRLWRYYNTSGHNKGTIGRPTPWITLLMSFVSAYLIFAISTFFVPRNLVFSSTITIITTILLLVLYMILGYNIIRRNFMLYIPILARIPINQRKETSVKTPFRERKETSKIKRKYKRRTKMIQTADGEIIYKKLTQRKFETYFNQNKPWLNPQLKITDLLDPLATNRSILSKYINQTYGMNFNRYINRLRLEEVKRLHELPNYSKLNIAKLASLAGFANLRNYTRALKTEEELEGRLVKQKKKNDE